jgi:hypothetical protein
MFICLNNPIFHERRMKMPLETGALTAGLEALARSTELPFPEFTAKLVTSTFDAILGATIHQMEAYADLVSSIAKTIKDFEVSNVTDGDVTRFLADNYPDGAGGTCARSNYEFIATPAAGDAPEETAGAKLGKVFYDLVDIRLRSVWTPDNDDDVPRPANPADYDSDDPTATTANAFTQEQVQRIRTGVRRYLAQGKLDQLRLMAREGMARIVVSDGHILSKLTFRVATTDQQMKTYTEYERQRLAAVGIGGLGASWGGIVAGAFYSTLRVKTMNEQTYNKATMDAQMIGEVKINFHSQTFPPIIATGGGA